MTELDLVEQNFRNIIHFNRYKLTRIRNGSNATNHFNQSRRKMMITEGILVRVYGRGGCRLKLSEKASHLLDILLEEKRAYNGD